MALVIATPILSGLHHHYARGSNFRERQGSYRWHYRKMRPCIEQSNGPVSLSLSQSCPDCIINTSGYDFRKGQILASWIFCRALPALRGSDAIRSIAHGGASPISQAVLAPGHGAMKLSRQSASLFKRLGPFALAVIKQFRANQGFLLAGAVAYYTLLSLVPLLILVLLALSHVVDEERLLVTLRTLLEFVVPGQADALVGELHNFFTHREVVGSVLIPRLRG